MYYPVLKKFTNVQDDKEQKFSKILVAALVYTHRGILISVPATLKWALDLICTPRNLDFFIDWKLLGCKMLPICKTS